MLWFPNDMSLKLEVNESQNFDAKAKVMLTFDVLNGLENSLE